MKTHLKNRYIPVALWGFGMVAGLTYPLIPARSHAASTSSAATPEVDTVKKFLSGLEKHDQKGMLDFLAPDAQAFRIRDSKLNVSKIQEVIASAFLANDASTPVSEPINNIGYQTLGNISTVWAAYEVHIKNNVHHCGHTIYGLVKVDGNWKIASIVDEGVTRCR